MGPPRRAQLSVVLFLVCAVVRCGGALQLGGGRIQTAAQRTGSIVASDDGRDGDGSSPAGADAILALPDECVITCGDDGAAGKAASDAGKGVAAVAESTASTDPAGGVGGLLSKEVWAGFIPTVIPDRPKAADTVLAGVGLSASIAALGGLEGVAHTTLFVPPMMASGIIFFANPAPPDPRGFLSGTLCSATLSAAILVGLDGVVPDVAAQGASAAMLLVWYKSVGSIFPPAAVLAGTLIATTVESAASLNDGIAAGLRYLLCPWLVGHAWLYGSALATGQLRAAVRVALTKERLRALDGLNDAQLFEVFDKFDADRSGELDAAELKVALKVVLGADLSIDDCERLVYSVDVNGNGLIDFDEFALIVRDEAVKGPFELRA